MPKFGTMGIEIEFTEVPQSSIYSTHDASVESRIITDKETVIIGGEIVSPVLENYYDVKEWLLNNIKELKMRGESIIGSQRDSIHIHVGYPARNISFLKKTLLWATRVDQHLFKLGGMGGKPRGYINDFLYYRPLCSPPVVRTRKGWGKVFITEDIMKVRTERGFWTRYGDSLNINRRYVAQRYVGINFYSMLRHGTLEFRHFNKFLNVTLIATIAEFLSLSVINSISSSYIQIEKLETFEDAIKFSGISPDKGRLLMYYYNKSEWDDYHNICKNNIICHLEIKGNLPVYYRDTRYCPENIDYDNLIEPVITDIHSGQYDYVIEKEV